MKDKEKYLWGIFKRFKKKYPHLTFTEFQKELERDDFDYELFHIRLEENQYGVFGEWI